MRKSPRPSYLDKIVTREELTRRLDILRRDGLKAVFTNGCFDLLHPGHTRYLDQARSLGDILVVGLNSDQSVRRQGKGPGRPFQSESARAEVLAALESVSLVAVFDQETPYDLIKTVRPDVLVKGGDWTVDRIVGGDLVAAGGGKVLSLPYWDGESTTEIIRRIQS